jgi:hypothetical protein
MRSHESALMLVMCLAAGCQRPDFVNSFRPSGDLSDPPTELSDIRFEQVPFHVLDEQRDNVFPGFRRLGISEFRGTLLRVRPNDPTSSLSKQAQHIGAHRVRWSEMPVGYRATATYSDAGGSLWTVADYLAVYYRREDSSAGGQ